MSDTREATKEVRKELRKDNRWKLFAAFSVFMLLLSVVLSLIITVGTRKDAVSTLKKANKESMEANARIEKVQQQAIDLAIQQNKSEEILNNLNKLLQLEAESNSRRGKVVADAIDKINAAIIAQIKLGQDESAQRDREQLEQILAILEKLSKEPGDPDLPVVTPDTVPTTEPPTTMPPTTTTTTLPSPPSTTIPPPICGSPQDLGTGPCTLA